MTAIFKETIQHMTRNKCNKTRARKRFTSTLAAIFVFLTKQLVSQ